MKLLKINLMEIKFDITLVRLKNANQKNVFPT